MSYSKYKLHHVLFPPFLSTVNLQTGSLQFFSYDSARNIRSYPISDPISFHVFFLVFDTGKLGKICRLHWKERLKLPNVKVIRLCEVAKIYGSSHVSGKLPTYPSPKPISLRAKCWLKWGTGGQFPKNVSFTDFYMVVVGWAGSLSPAPTIQTSVKFRDFDKSL